MNRATTSLVALAIGALPIQAAKGPPKNDDPLLAKARYLQRDLIDKHLLEGLYISIVPSVPAGTKLTHTIDSPGNVIHAGVWTGRYLAGDGYQYAVTKDPWVREHGWEILRGLRKLQEVTGKPGLLARGFVRGRGPVAGWERDGNDSKEWHQSQGKYADYRWYGDVSVDNFNAVLYGYAIYYDLAADAAQKQFIKFDVDRLMTHLLDNHCRIIDVDGEVTTFGHVGIDPDPARDEYYQKLYAERFARMNVPVDPWRPSLRSSLMLLPDLLIAHHLTGKQRYLDVYNRVVARFQNNPDRLSQPIPPYDPKSPEWLQRVARVNHSSEGQAYEALYNLIRYESIRPGRDPALLTKYRQWTSDLWAMNWMEGNSLFAFMTVAMMGDRTSTPLTPSREERVGVRRVDHGEEGLRLANQTLRLYPYDRVLRPVMNSLRKDLELNSFADRSGSKQSASPLPINQRPHDNEYEWKGNPYQLDGWLKPTVTQIQWACDDPNIAWFCDSAGRVYMTKDWKQWRDMSAVLMGAKVQNISASKTRTYVLYAQTDKGVFVARDGGMSWRVCSPKELPTFETTNFKEWLSSSGFPFSQIKEVGECALRINDEGELLRSTNGGKTSKPCMNEWRIPRATSVFVTSRYFIAGGPGGYHVSQDGLFWVDITFWPESETGAADYLHAYWMGRYYSLVAEK